MQLRRARFLSSERTMCQGAPRYRSPPASCRARANSHTSGCGMASPRAELPLAQRVVMRASKRRSCSSLLTSSQNLSSMIPLIDDVAFDDRAQLKKAAMLLFRAEAHHVLDAGAVVPTAIEDDDFARRRKVRHVALQVHLALLAIRSGRAAPRRGMTRGLTRSVIALMVPPLPAPSRPSKR